MLLFFSPVYTSEENIQLLCKIFLDMLFYLWKSSYFCTFFSSVPRKLLNLWLISSALMEWLQKYSITAITNALHFFFFLMWKSYEKLRCRSFSLSYISVPLQKWLFVLNYLTGSIRCPFPWNKKRARTRPTQLIVLF